ncbi:unnamed protein product [Leptidea sinapis]|uniref:UTP--glucose-1-phosphate uridylyltransferase n=1 Tax=Leptidea sinapis TaxID=189913 RepID=A0A5E4PT02_9NEOP|nr:unnamed protein product [Leptidea sinapis]
MTERHNPKIRSHQRTPSGSRDFKEATKRDALARLEVELERLVGTLPESKRPHVEKELKGFKNLFSRFLAEQGPSVSWDKIQKLPEGAVIDYSTLTTPTTDNIHHMLDKLVVVKLNGGLGTSMGCKGPKIAATRHQMVSPRTR